MHRYVELRVVSVKGSIILIGSTGYLKTDTFVASVLNHHGTSGVLSARHARLLSIAARLLIVPPVVMLEGLQLGFVLIVEK